jgi:hypothetical protein
MHSDWFPYSVAGAAAIAIAVGLWALGLWGDEHAGDSWGQFQASLAKSMIHADEGPLRRTPSTNVTHLQTSQP